MTDPVASNCASTSNELERAPLDVQANAFTTMVRTNPVNGEVLGRLPQLGLPDAWLAAGALFQTVWNSLTGREPGAGVRDYDINYFDPTDLSWAAQGRAIKAAAVLFADLGVTIEVRNEARVHLWYEDKFGVPCPPYLSTGDAIGTFPNCSSCFGMRTVGGVDQLIAPFGFADVFAIRARPNRVLSPRAVYEAKTARWREQWPELTVLPW